MSSTSVPNNHPNAGAGGKRRRNNTYISPLVNPKYYTTQNENSNSVKFKKPKVNNNPFYANPNGTGTSDSEMFLLSTWRQLVRLNELLIKLREKETIEDITDITLSNILDERRIFWLKINDLNSISDPRKIKKIVRILNAIFVDSPDKSLTYENMVTYDEKYNDSEEYINNFIHINNTNLGINKLHNLNTHKYPINYDPVPDLFNSLNYNPEYDPDIYYHILVSLRRIGIIFFKIDDLLKQLTGKSMLHASILVNPFSTNAGAGAEARAGAGASTTSVGINNNDNNNNHSFFLGGTKPKSTSIKRKSTSTKRKTTTTKRKTTSTKPKVTTTKPKSTTTKPKVTSTKRKVTSNKRKTTSTKRKTTSTKRKTTSTKRKA